MHKYLISGILALLLFAGCGSSDLGGILGDSTSPPTTDELRGVVDSIDLNNRSILLTNVRAYRSSLADGGLGGGETTRVYFDNNTTVSYQGRNYRPEDLERGDEVSARVDESGGRLIATSVVVLRDVSGGSSGIGSMVRGSVRYVDSSRRTIEIDRGNYSVLSVQYDANTDVLLQGRNYRPEDLERGDEVDVRVRDLGNGYLLAEDINVIRSVSGTSTSVDPSTLRGTVRYVDTSRRTIELGETYGAPRFSTGSGSTVVVRYDANTSVEYQGRTYSASNLERGDVVEVRVRDLGTGGLLAERITVVRDVNASF